MRSVTYSMGVSLTATSSGRTAFRLDGARRRGLPLLDRRDPEVGVHLMGRRLYETMLYWETADQDPSLDAAEREWTALWKPLPKVVFSTTLPAVQGNARLAAGGLAEEIERLRAEPEDGRHRDRRCDAGRRGCRIGPDRRVPGHGLPGAGGRWHSVLPPA